VQISAANSGPLAWLTCGYLLLLLVGGGGGSPAPLSELFCQILAALTLVAWVMLSGPAALKGQRALVWVAVLIVAVPAIQLVPLPPAVWHVLPGRDLLADMLGLVGAKDAWRPLSVAPWRTLEAVLALLPPLLAMAMVAGLSSADRIRVLKLIAGFALLSVMFGAAQMAGGSESPLRLYDGAAPGVLYGFQANRNAQVDVLLIGLIAACAAWHQAAFASRGAAIMLTAVILILLLGAVLTASRAGIAMIPIVLIWCLALRPSALRTVPRNRWTGVLAASALAAAGLVAALLQSRAFAQIQARFDLTGEYRPDIWRDTVFAIGQYWPVGSGLGTFTRVIGPAERLEAIGTTLPNRAHNEYLELLLEAGLPGALAWLIVAGIVLAALGRSLRSASTVPRPQAVFAGTSVTLVMLHSLVDYPLRSTSLAGLVGVGAAFVLAPPRSGTQKI